MKHKGFAGEVEGLSVSVAKADGEKCERCWKFSTTVGKDANHAELCAHCAAVIAKWKNNLTCIIKNYKGAETNRPLSCIGGIFLHRKKHIWCAVMIILITAFDPDD